MELKTFALRFDLETGSMDDDGMLCEHHFAHPFWNMLKTNGGEAMKQARDLPVADAS